MFKFQPGISALVLSITLFFSVLIAYPTVAQAAKFVSSVSFAPSNRNWVNLANYQASTALLAQAVLEAPKVDEAAEATKKAAEAEEAEEEAAKAEAKAAKEAEKAKKKAAKAEAKKQKEAAKAEAEAAEEAEKAAEKAAKAEAKAAKTEKAKEDKEAA